MRTQGTRRTLAATVLSTFGLMLAPIVILAAIQLVVGRQAAHRADRASQEIRVEMSAVLTARDALRQLEAAADAAMQRQEGSERLLAMARSSARAAFEGVAGFDAARERRLAAALERDLDRALGALGGGMPSAAPGALVPFRAAVRTADRRLGQLGQIGLIEVARDSERTRAAQEVQLLVLLAGLVLGLLLALWQARRLRDRIQRPLRELGDAAKRIGGGKPVDRVDVETDDELAALAEAFNTMAERIADSRRDLEHQALHDALTGLPNRTLLTNRVAHALAPGRRGAERRVAVMVLDLDDFKKINDSYGHSAGDALLIELRRRLYTAVRPEDTVARLGGDEFGLLVHDAASDEQALEIAERVRAAVGAPARVAGARVQTSASVGVAIAGPGAVAEELLRNADVAMYRAKAERRGVVAFEPWMHAETVRRVELEEELRGAIAAGALELHYQPIVALPGGEVAGVEALVRWQHPERGMISPGEFIPLAEHSGSIVELGTWVLDHAVGAARRLQTWGVESMSINVSPRQFAEPDFCDVALAAAERHGLAPERIVLEVTEGMLVADPAAAADRIRRLHERGFRVAIDDFGTGYSSLSYLSSFTVDVLKIDRAFVRNVADPAGSDRAVAEAIVALGRSLGMTIVAEGVETEPQRETLVDLGCDAAQGFLFHRPMREPDLLRRIGRFRRSGRRWESDVLPG
jgi:diguanylate cyclase (GGDEF)-like protein